LQAVAIWFMVSYNRFHRAKFLGIANEITGRVNQQYDKVENYFSLKEENRRLHRFNDSLLRLLPGNFMKPDTGSQIVTDSIAYDTSGSVRRYITRSATVIYNTVNADKNYIQLNRGSDQGIKDNMAVISSDGSAVGQVINVSPNFSQVMSLLNVQSKVKGSLKKSGNFGTIEWNGKDPRYLTFKDIPKSIPVQKGDTVITSYISFNFPPGYMIGTIEEIVADKSTNFYVLSVKTSANFYNLQQVFVFENLQYDEQVKLDKDTKKAIDLPKRNQP
jgi:rod shape-determining protein MreC